jgi:signal recognition particle GTPase
LICDTSGRRFYQYKLVKNLSEVVNQKRRNNKSTWSKANKGSI